MMLLLVVALLLQGLGNTWLYADYLINREAYAAYCVNKARPALQCNGKCQLMQKLEKKEQQDKNATPPAEIKLELVVARHHFVQYHFLLPARVPLFSDHTVVTIHDGFAGRLLRPPGAA
jgi:hypothetical protein